MKKLFVSLAFLMNIFTVYCQTRGVVLDVNNIPINKVDVYFSDQNILISTNEDGLFFIDEMLPNNSNIHFYKTGYSLRSIRYQSGTQLKIILESLHITLDEIGVSESFTKLGNSKLTNIEKQPLKDVFLNANSMLESIIDLSGIDMISSGLGIQKIVVRGLSGMRVVTYLNGMKINNQQWANDHGIGFTDLGLNEVELIKGSSALRYGSEAIGGLLYFKDQPFVSSDKIQGFVATKFNNSSYLSSSQFGLKWNKKNIYFNLYGQYSISSDYRLPNNDYLFNSRFKQNAVKFSIAYRLKKSQNIFRYQLHNEATGIPAHIHGDPSLVDLMELTSSSLDLNTDYNPTRPTQFINNQLFTYEFNYIQNSLKISLHAGHFINNLQEYEKWSRPAFDLTIAHTQLSPNISYQVKDLTFNIGSSISSLNNMNGVGEERLVPDAYTFNIGPYLIVDYEKNNIGFNSGVRYDKKRIKSEDKMLDDDYDNTFSGASFSLGGYCKFTDHIFRATYSGAFRAPDFSELFSNGIHHGTNRYEIGDVDLNIEYADQLDFKYQWSDDHLGFVFNPFIQYVSDFITINPMDSFINGNRVYNYSQFNKVQLQGIELNLHYHPHRLHDLHIEQSYSFLEAINKNSQYGLALIPANSIKTKVLFDFNNYDNFSRYKFDYLSLTHLYKFSQENFAEYEELTKSYNVFNLRLGLKFNDNFHASLAINNLFNEEYSPHISRVRGVAGGVPNPGRFLNINLKYEF